MKASTKYRLIKKAKLKAWQTWKTLRALLIIGTCYLCLVLSEYFEAPWIKFLILPVAVIEWIALFPKSSRFTIQLIIYKGDFTKIPSRKKTPEQKAYAKKIAQDCCNANDAFRNNDYEAVVILLEPHEKNLSPVLKEKLKYARKKQRQVLNPNLVN